MVTRKQEKLFSFRKLFLYTYFDKKNDSGNGKCEFVDRGCRGRWVVVRTERTLAVPPSGRARETQSHATVLDRPVDRTRRNCLRVGILHGRRVSSNPTSRRSFRRLVGKYDLHRQ